MDNFTVSAIKYRPSTFTTVVGQPSITSTLKSAIKNNHLAHAYLFCGPRGVGKTTCARIFAKTLNCSNRTSDAEACNECESCNAFNQDRSFNIHELDAASNSSVDNIRTLIDQVRIPPQIGIYSLYIIDEVHMLSSSAFNAFLKTLEEPPAHAVFILATTEKHKIIPTILSRCQIFDFHRISIKDIISQLQFVAEKENVSAEEEGLNIIAQKADGSLRDALSIFDQIVSFTGNNVSYQDVINNLNVLDHEYYFKLIDSFLSSDYSKALIIFNEILNSGFDGHNFINGSAKHLRDLLVCKDTQTIELLDTGAKLKERYSLQANRCTVDFIFEALKICGTCDVNYKTSKNNRLHIEIALLELCNIIAIKKKITEQPGSPVKEVSTEVVKEPEPAKISEIKEEEIPKPQMTGDKTNDQQTISVKEAYKLIGSNNLHLKNGDDKNNYEQENKENLKVEITEFTEQELIDTWTNYINEYKEEKRLFTILTSGKPMLLENYTVEYLLKNATQENEIRDIKLKLLNYLKRELKNTKIELNFKLEEIESEDDPKKRLYTDQDKFKYMNEKNPNLEKLKQQLNLDFL